MRTRSGIKLSVEQKLLTLQADVEAYLQAAEDEEQGQ